MKMRRLLFALTLFTISTSIFSQNTNQKPPSKAVPFLGIALDDNTELEEGVLVEGVYKGYAAAAAGLQRGDILLAINGDDVNSSRELTKELRPYKSGDQVEVSFKRFNKENKVKALLTDKPKSINELKMMAHADEATGKKRSGKKAFMGIYPQTDWQKGGVRITGFTQKSQAWRAGLEENDVITKLDEAEISTYDQLNAYLWEKEPNQEMKVTFLRDGKEKSLTMTLAESTSSDCGGCDNDYSYENYDWNNDGGSDDENEGLSEKEQQKLEKLSEKMAELGERMGELSTKAAEKAAEQAEKLADEIERGVAKSKNRNRSRNSNGGDWNYDESFFSLREFSVSPNPTAGNLTVSFQGRSNQNFAVVVTDEDGKEIAREERDELAEGLFTHQFDLTKLPAGNYYVRIWKGDDVITSQKVEKK